MEDIHSSQSRRVCGEVPIWHLLPSHVVGREPREMSLPARATISARRDRKRFALAIAVVATLAPLHAPVVHGGEPVEPRTRTVRTPAAQSGSAPSPNAGPNEGPNAVPNAGPNAGPNASSSRDRNSSSNSTSSSDPLPRQFELGLGQPQLPIRRLPLPSESETVMADRVVADLIKLVEPSKQNPLESGKLEDGQLCRGELGKQVDFDQLGLVATDTHSYEASVAAEEQAATQAPSTDANFSTIVEPTATPEPRDKVADPPIWNVYISNPQPAAVPPPVAPPAPISIYSVPPAPQQEVDPEELRRQQIAAKVSDGILRERSNNRWKTTFTPVSESLTAVQMLRECEEKTIAADRLLKRGAAYAARAEVIEAIRCFAVATDLKRGGREATEALESALNALREAGDFLGRYGNVDSAGIARMVASHQTEILKDQELESLTPHAAADTYLDFARQNLSLAVAGDGQGARLLLLLANTERARKTEDSKIADAVALTCLRAAVASNPQDPLLSSELGFLALRSGQLGEARWALQRSLDIQPSAPALQNLAETFRLAGDTQTARELIAELADPAGAPARSMLVTTVSPNTFAQISPPVQSQQVGNSSAPQAQGFHNGPPRSQSQPPPQDVAPSVLERMANAIQKPWR